MVINMYFILGIVIIYFIIKKKKEKETKKKQTTFDYNKENSYYNKDHVKQYTGHEDHRSQEKKEKPSVSVKSVNDEIGYKKCPDCGNAISKKAKTCFMCDHVFEEVNIHEK